MSEKKDGVICHLTPEEIAAMTRMCRRLAAETGDSVAVVDTVIWRAANLGMV